MCLIGVLFWLRVEELEVKLLDLCFLLCQVVQFGLLELLFGVDADCLRLQLIVILDLAPQLAKLASVLQVLPLSRDL